MAAISINYENLVILFSLNRKFFLKFSHWQKIPFAEVWSKSFVSYHIELIQTGKVGLCKIIVAQEQPVNGNSSAVLNLKNTSEVNLVKTIICFFFTIFF